jgi:phosphoribosylanthranilate isomerase
VTIKICGITREEDARCAASLGVHALGFVLWPDSPRAVTLERAGAIIDRLPPFVVPVGVFVDPTCELLAQCRECGIHVAQIVGSVPRIPSGMRLLRVVSLAPGGERVVPEVPGNGPLLVDAHDPVRRGGTGRTIDWTAVAHITRQRPVILAGGLGPDNVGEAIRLARPAGVDVSSGVEAAPGIKDPDKMAAFVAAVRQVA